MGIGGGVFLAAVGAVLDFAVADNVSGVNLHTVGLILLIAGIAIALLDAVLLMPRRRRSHVLVDDGVHQPTAIRRDTYV